MPIITTPKETFVLFEYNPRTDTQGTDVVDERCLSQWWPCKFHVSTVDFTCSEMWMALQKSLIFGDEYSYKDIRYNTPDPVEMTIKARAVVNYNEYVWSNTRHDIALIANIHKFDNNQELKDFIVGTKDFTLVCCDGGLPELPNTQDFDGKPHSANGVEHISGETLYPDAIWGIGYTLEQAMKLDPDQLSHLAATRNTLGRILMECRDVINNNSSN